jgi:four helix bundle protein
MSTIKRFEDISAWQKSRELTKMIYAITNTGAFAKDFGLRDQIRRASVSVMSNIAEGFERDSTKFFIQFLKYAKASAGEVRAQLYVALDVGYIQQQEFDNLTNIAIQISKMLSSLIKYLKSTLTKGN